MSDAPWDNTPHDQATDAFYEAARPQPVLLAIKPPETQPGVAQLYFTLDELKFLGNIFDARCKGFEGRPEYGINNSLRTMFREAQYGLEPYRG
jgi:hypothetical protein